MTSHTVVDVLPRDAIPSIEDPMFEDSFEGIFSGRTLVRLPSRRRFAFTWQDDHGPGAFDGVR